MGQNKFPSTYRYILGYLYPYLNTTSSLQAASEDKGYGSNDFIPQPALDGLSQALALAGDRTASGGNSMLYDVLYEVTATITTTGNISGDEVPQLYVELGGDNPPRQLGDFARLHLRSGESATFTATLTRRDS